MASMTRKSEALAQAPYNGQPSKGRNLLHLRYFHKTRKSAMALTMTAGDSLPVDLSVLEAIANWRTSPSSNRTGASMSTIARKETTGHSFLRLNRDSSTNCG